MLLIPNPRIPPRKDLLGNLINLVLNLIQPPLPSPLDNAPLGALQLHRIQEQADPDPHALQAPLDRAEDAGLLLVAQSAALMLLQHGLDLAQSKVAVLDDGDELAQVGGAAGRVEHRVRVGGLVLEVFEGGGEGAGGRRQRGEVGLGAGP